MCVPFMRERAESMSYEIIQTSPNGIVLLDNDLNVVQINAKAKELLGIREYDVKGQGIFHYFNPTDFVLAQKNGLDEQISEEINQISGGEKQRVGLARAIYKDTDILLLDEVTSSLDKETAYRVEKNILALRDKTVLNVSHKLHADLLEKYDYICVMDGGKIVGFAPPAALLKNNALSQYMDA